MEHESLIFNFDELVEFIKDTQGISYSELARQLEMSNQMFKKWKRGESLPSHKTIIKLLDLCTREGIKDIKFNWEAYLSEVMESTDYEISSEINYDLGTVTLTNIKTGIQTEVPVCDIEPGHIKNKIFEGTNEQMTLEARIIYHFTSHEEIWNRLQASYDYIIKQPLTTENAGKLGNILTGMINEDAEKQVFRT